MNLWMVIGLLAAGLTQSPQRDLQLVSDGRSLAIDPSRKERLAPHQAIFEREVLPAARGHWGDEAGRCDPHANNFRIIDVADGAFTRPGAKQVAILYVFCETAHNFALDGLAITEGDRVVAHVVYEGAWDAAVGALPDINRNGLSEIVIDTRGMNHGELWAGITIIEVPRLTVKRLGNVDIETDACGAIGKHRGEAHTIHVKPGTTPVFYRETFVRGCERNAQWRKSGALQRIHLRESDIEYRRLK